MPEAIAAKKPAAPAKKPVQQAVKSAPSRAAQAAQHQGRPPEANAPPPRTSVQPPPPNSPRSSVPAQVRPALLPAFMRNDADLGKENIHQQDMEIPRLKLMQGLSPELEQFDRLRPGHFFHPAAELIFDGPFRAVPIYMDVRYILWRPRESGGGILARADDGIHWSPSSGEFTVQLDKKDGGHTVTWRLAPTVQQSGLANWGTLNPDDPNSPPAATLMYNFLLAFPDEPDLLPAVLSFQRSSIKIGRRFNTKLKTVRAPLFGTVWEFSAVKDPNASGNNFFNIDVKGAGLVEDQGLYEQYKGLYESVSNKGLSIKDIEGLQDDGAAAEAGADDPNAPAY